jgi:hypothetical protein
MIDTEARACGLLLYPSGDVETRIKAWKATPSALDPSRAMLGSGGTEGYQRGLRAACHWKAIRTLKHVWPYIYYLLGARNKTLAEISLSG